MGIITYDPGGYGSGTSRTLYLDGQVYGTVQIPESYRGLEESYIQSMFGRFGHVTQSQVTPEQQKAAVSKAQTLKEQKAAEQERYREEQKFARGSFAGREAQTRLYGGTPIVSPVGVEAAKASEIHTATNKTFFLGTASGDFRERPRELTPESGKAIVSSFYPTPQQPEQTQQPSQLPSLSRFIPPIPSLMGDTQTSIGLKFYPSQSGSPAERYAFEQKRSELYTYKPALGLMGISKGLQTGFETAIGYNEKAPLPIKALSGFGSVFTGLPAFAGQVGLAGEFAIRHPTETITKAIPIGGKIFISQMATEISTKPVEFGGSLVGIAVLSGYRPKIKVGELLKSERASLEFTPKRQPITYAEPPTISESLKNLRVKSELPKSSSYLERTSTQGNYYGKFETQYAAELKARAAPKQFKAPESPEFTYGTPEFFAHAEYIKKFPLIEPVEVVAARWANQKLLSPPPSKPVISIKALGSGTIPKPITYKPIIPVISLKPIGQKETTDFRVAGISLKLMDKTIPKPTTTSSIQYKIAPKTEPSYFTSTKQPLKIMTGMQPITSPKLEFKTFIPSVPKETTTFAPPKTTIFRPPATPFYKPPRKIISKYPKSDTALFSLKKKRKSKRIGRLFFEISPVKAVGTNIFKGMGAYKPLKVKGLKL